MKHKGKESRFYWEGKPEEFLELAMLVETLHFDLMGSFHEPPSFDELGHRLQSIVRVDLSPYQTFTDLRMNAKPEGRFFYKKMNVYEQMQKEEDKMNVRRLLLAIENNDGHIFPLPEDLEFVGRPYIKAY